MMMLDSDEKKAALKLVEALGSSLDVNVVLRAAYPLLTQLVPADYGALGVSASGQPEDFEWAVAELPHAFFEAYPEMAAHDFVRSAVAARPNVVLRDEEMVPRGDLEANALYQRAREIGAPLEQVMAVMLHIDDRWQSGFSLYRERRRPFSAKEQALLQQLTPALANAVRNCHQYGAATDWKGALELVLESQGESVLLADCAGREVARTAGVTELLSRWFEPHERRRGHLPAPLAEYVRPRSGSVPPRRWRKQGSTSTLEVSIAPLTGYSGPARWLLRFREQAAFPPLPAVWRQLLTPREQEVAGAVLLGWTNKLIAAELHCAEATVKKHLQAVFDKLGLPSRSALLASASGRT